MTPLKFQIWLETAKEVGIIDTDADAAELLGVTKLTIINYKRRGCSKHVALACQALLLELPPYGDW